MSEKCNCPKDGTITSIGTFNGCKVHGIEPINVSETPISTIMGDMDEAKEMAAQEVEAKRLDALADNCVEAMGKITKDFPGMNNISEKGKAAIRRYLAYAWQRGAKFERKI